MAVRVKTTGPWSKVATAKAVGGSVRETQEWKRGGEGERKRGSRGY